MVSTFYITVCGILIIHLVGAVGPPLGRLPGGNNVCWLRPLLTATPRFLCTLIFECHTFVSTFYITAVCDILILHLVSAVGPTFGQPSGGSNVHWLRPLPTTTSLFLNHLI
jgi:hypothetical protein